MMRYLFSTGSLWTYGIERCFDFGARAGFDGIELMVDQRWDTRQPEYLNSLSERFGQPIVAVHSPFSPTTPGWPGFFDEPGRIQASVRLAEAVGAGIVVHHLPERYGYLFIQQGERRALIPWPGRKAKLRYRDWLLSDYLALQAETDVRLCIENMPARRRLGRRWNVHFWNTLEEIVRFPSLTLDTTHLGTWGIDAADIYPSLKGYVRHVHLSNFDGREHRRPEAGHLHLDRLLARMAADGYDGAITLELHPDALDAGKEDAHVVALLTNSLRLCRAWAGQCTE
jgi:sugar phosphate isomerase/epimerase